jgi:hypothetical protein
VKKKKSVLLEITVDVAELVYVTVCRRAQAGEF